MAENKTKPTKIRPATFIARVDDERRRKDCRELIGMMRDITGQPPKMWGPSIVGFDQYHYKYESGCEGDILLTGFSPLATLRKRHPRQVTRSVFKLGLCQTEHQESPCR